MNHEEKAEYRYQGALKGNRPFSRREAARYLGVSPRFLEERAPDQQPFWERNHWSGHAQYTLDALNTFMPGGAAENFAPDQAAAFLKLSKRTLESWRKRKFGPAWIQLSPKMLRYPLANLMSWKGERQSEP